MSKETTKATHGPKIETTTVTSGLAVKNSSEKASRSPKSKVTNAVNETMKSQVNVTMRIMGGVLADIRDFPYQASVLRWVGSGRKRSRYFCGGAIIGARWILTAAHCVEDEAGGPLNPDDVNVVVGLDRYDGLPRLTVTNVYHHPGYKGKPPLNDIAIVRLSDKLQYTERVARIRIARNKEEEERYVGKPDRARITGFGRQSLHGRIDSYLRVASVTIFSDRQCNALHPGFDNRMFICAGNMEGGKDACSGDSGGPLVVRGRYGEVIVGVVSGNIGCGKVRQPGYYMRVSYYIKWICRIINCFKNP